MAENKTTSWRCVVCGYVHYGTEPPESCPICGASSTDFEAYEQADAEKSSPNREWVCMICQYKHTGDNPPDECPLCGAGADRFESISGEQNKRARTDGSSREVIVIGAGIAGLSAAESAREASPDSRIVLVSKEKHLPYYRLNLTRYLAGEISDRDLPIHPRSWYSEKKIDLLLGTEAISFSKEEKKVTLNDGQVLSFDKLVLATGAHPFVPPFQGVDRKGVMSVRTIDDARHILETLQKGMRCVCIGGGILGIETAAAIAKHGAHVSLLEGFGWLMPRQLNRKAGELLKNHVQGLGIALYTEARTKAITGEGRADGVLLEDGTRIPADLVLVTTGIRSNVHLAQKEGVSTQSGIRVDSRLRSSHPDIYAVGDVAEHQGTVYGLWAPAQYQGDIAGANAVGGDLEFGGIPRSNTLKVIGVELFSIGQFEPSDGSYVSVTEEHEGRFAHFLFRDNRMTGAILIGDTSVSSLAKKAVESKKDLSSLLQKRPKASEVLDHLRSLS